MELTTIGGVSYKTVVDSTLEHDIFVQAQLSRAGLDRLEMLPDELNEDFATRIFRKACADADVFLILGGMIMPSAIPASEWTPDLAAQTGLIFRKLLDPVDKAKVTEAITGVVLNFFASGLSRCVHFQKSSTSAQSDQPGGDSASPGEPSITETGATSSENSPDSMYQEPA